MEYFVMIHTTPPDRSTWHHVPPGEIHHGTFTEVYGYEFRPGFAFRCGDCPQVGVGYRNATAAAVAAEQHRAEDHPASRVQLLWPLDRSLVIAYATPAEWPELARG